MTARDLDNLAFRIEQFQNQPTAGWEPSDALEFRNLLPDSRVQNPRWKLPSPARVREAAQALREHKDPEFGRQEYQQALQQCHRLESLVHDNRRGSVQRIIRDMRRGRLPR